MASISSELQTIRSGIFGKDVRSAIADGLEKINENGGPGESAGGMVLESNGCGGWQCGGTNVSGTDILSNVKKGLMPVMYTSGFYAPVICVESTTQAGQDAIQMWYYYGGCSTPTLANTTVVM